jgi:hypothetical protein
MRCENELPKDRWPYSTRCLRDDETVRRRTVAVGKEAGTWDTIWEDHYICSSCIELLQSGGMEVKGNGETTVPSPEDEVPDPL